MNPLKKQNSFEQKLQENLDGMEFKPSDALWDKIAQNISADSFEPKLQQKLQDFSVDPKPETWEQLESQLPERKKRFGWLFFSSLVLAVALAGGIAFYPSAPKQVAVNAPSTAPNLVQPETQNDQIAATPKKAKGASIASKNKQALINKPQESQLLTPPTAISTLNAKAEPSAKSKKSVSKKASANQSNAATPFLLAEASNAPKSKASIGLNQTPPPAIEAPKSSQNPSSQNQALASPSLENQNKPKEIASEKPSAPNKILLDSQVITPVTQTNAYMESDLDLSKLSIVATIGIHGSFMQLSAPNSGNQNLEKTLALRKEIEKPEIDFSANLSGEYAITEKFYVRLGIGILSFSQDVRYNLAKADSIPQRELDGNFFVHNTDSIVVGGVYSTKNKYSFTEIPVWLGYKMFRGNKLGIDLNMGMSYGRLNLVNAYLPDASCIGLMVVSDKASFPTYKNMWFLNVAPAVTWQVNSFLDIGVMPQLRLGLNNMVENEQWIGQKPWSAGLNLFLRKRF